MQSHQKAVQVQDALRQIIARRLHLTLQTNHAKITSNEAKLVLRELVDHPPPPSASHNHDDDDDDDTNIKDEIHDHHHHEHDNHPKINNNNNNNNGFWERRKKSYWVDAEIQTLAKLETEFVEAQIADANIQEQYQNTMRERVRAQTQLDAAQRKEAELWKQYQQAKQRTVERRQALERWNAEVRYAEHEAQKTSYEVEKSSTVLDRQSSIVRKMLATAYQKEQKYRQKHQLKRRQRQQQQQQERRQSNNENRPDKRNENNNNNAVSFEEFVVKQKAGSSMNPTDYPAVRRDETVDNDTFDWDKISTTDRNKTPSLEDDHWWDLQAATNTTITNTDPENEERLRFLDDYQAQERELANLAESLQVESAKLLSRANKLRERARELERSY
jgi:hypothetical protein